MQSCFLKTFPSLLPHHELIRDLITGFVALLVMRQIAFLLGLPVVVEVHVFDELLRLPSHHLVEL